MSIAATIFEHSQTKPALSESSHKLALEYLSIQLAIRDREKLIEVLCHSQPDLLTSLIRELVKVYDPIIRALHNAVDLTAGVSDLQNFLNDLISLSLLDKKAAAKPPTVQDFVHLLQKHQGSSHVFIHQALKNGKELSSWYHEYAIHAIGQYKQKSNLKESTAGGTAAGDFTPCLNTLVSSLSEEERHQVFQTLDHHVAFLNLLAQRSKERMSKIVQASLSSETSTGSIHGNPGIFLYKWQHFMDETVVTPGLQKGSPRTAKQDSVKEATAVGVEGNKAEMTQQAQTSEDEDLRPPDVDDVIRLLGPGFRDELLKLVDAKKGQEN